MSNVRVKFCGLVRPADVEYAGELSAAYLGAVLARGARQRSVEQVHTLLRGCTMSRRVAVLGSGWRTDARALLDGSTVDVLQLHADPDEGDIAVAHDMGAREVWAAVRIGAAGLPQNAQALCRAADAVVLDTRHATALGGTGAAFDWERVAAQLRSVRGSAAIVVAGGLTPENVAQAIRVLRPDVVDVSSGVEVAPGVKDRTKMLAFMDAVRGAT